MTLNKNEPQSSFPTALTCTFQYNLQPNLGTYDGIARKSYTYVNVVKLEGVTEKKWHCKTLSSIEPLQDTSFRNSWESFGQFGLIFTPLLTRKKFAQN